MAKNATSGTLVVNNFGGLLTYFPFGDINSGRGDIRVNSGANPIFRPGSLTWVEQMTQINPNEDVITDLIMDCKERVESNILYVYAIGHTGRLYKIQVNDPTTYNADYDNPVLLTTLTVGTPTFTRGGFIDFFGTSEKIFIGHDKGVTSINFDGTSEAAISGSWTQTVPRPLKQFVGKLYAGNGSNIAEIDASGVNLTSTKLSPGFPTNTQVRDMDLSTDGNYLEIVVSTLPLGNITSGTQDVTITASMSSYIFSWNGVDVGYTSSNYYPTFALDANTTFQNNQYIVGRDISGTSVFSPTQKITEVPEMNQILPNAVASIGNMLSFMAPLYFLGVQFGQMYWWGNWDWEVGQPAGYWGMGFILAKAPETDVIQIPMQKVISGSAFGASTNQYPNNRFGSSKMYVSSLETSSLPTTKYRLYKWRLNTSPQDSTVITPPPEVAIYQTQTQLFSKRVSIKEVRIYSDPWVDGNAFYIYQAGPDNTPIMGTERTFDTADGSLTVGADFAWYNPESKPTYAVGLYIENRGTTNFIINKVEIDWAEGGE